MFTAWLVFARSAGKDDAPALVDSWCPQAAPLDQTLLTAGLPRCALLQEFCFPAKKGSGGTAPLAFSFTLTTSQSADRAYGFCLRTRAVTSNRLDLAADVVETSCFVTRHPFFKMFPHALQIVRVRRALDRESAIDFIEKLHATAAFAAPRVAVESLFRGVVCRYELPMLKEPSLSCLFTWTNPTVLHYIMGVILLERRVVFVAQHEAILSSVINAILYLLCADAFFPSILVPIVPSSMLEQGVSSPTPFVVGILRPHLKVIDAIPQLGDLVIVDLDRLQVRLAPGASPIVPFGISPDNDGIQQRSSSGPPGDDFRPWADVCGPFAKDVATAYANRDEDLLRAAVRAALSILIDGQKLDDPLLRGLYAPYRRTQLSTLLQPEVTSLGNRGYANVRLLLSSNLAQAAARDRQSAIESKGLVDQLTSSSSVLKRGPEMARVLAEVAKRSFDVCTHADVADVLLKQRLSESSGRNWKPGFRAMAVLDHLARAGSEVALASMWDNLPGIFAQTKFSAQGVVGLPQRVTTVMRKRATNLYGLVVDLAELRYVRSQQAHPMLLKVERARMLQTIARLPVGRTTLHELLDKARPQGITPTPPAAQQRASSSASSAMAAAQQRASSSAMAAMAAASSKAATSSRTESPNPFDADLLGMGAEPARDAKPATGLDDWFADLKPR